jgi:hypothetical protein
MILACSGNFVWKPTFLYANTQVGPEGTGLKGTKSTPMNQASHVRTVVFLTGYVPSGPAQSPPFDD